MKQFICKDSLSNRLTSGKSRSAEHWPTVCVCVSVCSCALNDRKLYFPGFVVVGACVISARVRACSCRAPCSFALFNYSFLYACFSL